MATSPLRWLLCDLQQGYVIKDLPLAGSSIKRQLSDASDGTWTFGPTDPLTPPGWQNMIIPGRTMIVAVLNGEPIQAWPITQLDVHSSDAPSISGPTLEGLLTRVFVRTYEAYGVDEAVICAEIASQVFAPGFNFHVFVKESGTARDAYHDGSQDLTIRAMLDEYAASEPPIEFMCSVQWEPGFEGQRIRKNITIGSALGGPTSVKFDGASIMSYGRSSSFAEGYGATRIWAVSDGNGDSRPMEGPFESDQIAAYGPWESRPSFSTATDEADLAARGRQSIQDLADGTDVWDFTLRLDTAPKVGRDWDIGSTVAFTVDPSWADPIGGTYSGRVLAWELDTKANTITPTLAQQGGAE